MSGKLLTVWKLSKFYKGWTFPIGNHQSNNNNSGARSSLRSGSRCIPYWQPGMVRGYGRVLVCMEGEPESNRSPNFEWTEKCLFMNVVMISRAFTDFLSSIMTADSTATVITKRN